jgi:DnaJ-class molecular chaperone
MSQEEDDIAAEMRREREQEEAAEREEVPDQGKPKESKIICKTRDKFASKEDYQSYQKAYDACLKGKKPEFTFRTKFYSKVDYQNYEKELANKKASLCSVNHYEVLGVFHKAKLKDIKEAYREASMEMHPDKGGDQKMFQNLANSYEVLVDQDLKAEYDKFCGHTNELYHDF